MWSLVRFHTPRGVLALPPEGGFFLDSSIPRRLRIRPSPALFRRQEVPMLKALLTPIILGLAVAMVIRMTWPRRAH